MEILKTTEFENNIKSLSISRKEFSDMTGMSYNTVVNWNDKNKPIPAWVESWLENYKAKKDLDKVVEAVRPYVKPE